MQLVLSLFPGIDLLGRAFEEVGFCVVRGPDVIFGGDIRGWHVPPGRFDGVIGGPPCQCFSSLANIVRHNGHETKFGNLIPEFERVVREASPAWFLMENVPRAPVPVVDGYAAWSTLLDNRQLGEAQRRTRRWTFGVRGTRYRVLKIETVALESREYESAACGGHSGTLARVDRRRRVGKANSIREYRTGTSCLGENYKTQWAFAELKRKQGLPADFELPGWTVAAKCQAVGNGVPMAMGRAMARAIMLACEGIEYAVRSTEEART
jgi:DNA (cytosine-5)-methyltransferase 1